MRPLRSLHVPEGMAMSKRPNLKKAGPVATADSWEHQHPQAPGRVPGVLAQARVKLQVAKAAMLSGIVAALEVERAEQDLKRKETGTDKFQSAKSWLRLQSTGRELSPEEYVGLRGTLTEQYGYFLKDRGGKRKGAKFRCALESAVFEEFAVECAPQVSYGLQAADEAGEDVGDAVDFLFEGVPEEFERVTGFKVVLRARHTDEGILHDQLIWAKTDGAGRKLGRRPTSTRWTAIQVLGPAMLGARRWRALVGDAALGSQKSKGIDAAVDRRKRECREVFELAPDAAMADFVDGKLAALKIRFPKLVPYLDAADRDYRAAVEMKLRSGLQVDEIFEREAKASAEAERAKREAIEAHEKAQRAEASQRQTETVNAQLQDELKTAMLEVSTTRAEQTQSRQLVDELRFKLLNEEKNNDSLNTTNQSLSFQLQSATERLDNITKLVDEFAEAYGDKLEPLIHCLDRLLAGDQPPVEQQTRLVPSLGTRAAQVLSPAWKDLLPVLRVSTKYGSLAERLMNLDCACRAVRMLNEAELNGILAAAHRHGQGAPRRGDKLLLSEDTLGKVQQASITGTAPIQMLAAEVLDAIKQSVLIRAAAISRASDVSRAPEALLSK